jgi:hypothetical protein
LDWIPASRSRSWASSACSRLINRESSTIFVSSGIAKNSYFHTISIGWKLKPISAVFVEKEDGQDHTMGGMYPKNSIDPVQEAKPESCDENI